MKNLVMICKPCRREQKKPGKHRWHDCEGSVILGSVAGTCRCECREKLLAAVASHGFPDMALPSLTPADDTPSPFRT